ncbi:MAG: UDP-N-acetylglucosamine 2-epimerase, partial [Leptonema sp. (in: bacteria)]
MTKILLVFGTRPEAIKFAPLYWEFKKHKNYFDLKVCVTAQHRQMLDQVLNFFEIKPDFDLNLMKKNQTLFDITSECLKGLEKVYDDFKPDLVFVQGDTTTAFVGALAAFYKKIKIAHLEAGFRSFHKYSPFPEEI